MDGWKKGSRQVRLPIPSLEDDAISSYLSRTRIFMFSFLLPIARPSTTQPCCRHRFGRVAAMSPGKVQPWHSPLAAQKAKPYHECQRLSLSLWLLDNAALKETLSSFTTPRPSRDRRFHQKANFDYLPACVHSPSTLLRSLTIVRNCPSITTRPARGGLVYRSRG
jgi:hypothetical protein